MDAADQVFEVMDREVNRIRNAHMPIISVMLTDLQKVSLENVQKCVAFDDNRRTTRTNTGSAVVLNTMYALTSYHLTKKATNFFIGEYEANKIAEAPESDLALLKFIQPTPFKTIALADENPKDDERIIFGGYPGSAAGFVALGAHSMPPPNSRAILIEKGEATVVMGGKTMKAFSAAILDIAYELGGMSGGIVINADGKLLGINSQEFTYSHYKRFAPILNQLGVEVNSEILRLPGDHLLIYSQLSDIKKMLRLHNVDL